jgi:hypothetical protein
LKPIRSKGPIQSLSILVGLVPVALALAWSIHHPLLASMTVEGRTFSLGTTPRGDYLRHSWVIRNGGPNPLKLRTHFTSGHCGFSLWLGRDYFLPAGEQLTVSLTCPTPDQGDVAFSSYVDVHTDDPSSPKVRFRVFGVTAP